MTQKIAPSLLDPDSLTLIRDSNRIINGDFSVNQRAFAGGALGVGVYGHDRWKGGAAGATYTVASNVATITAGTLVQIVEGTGAGEFTLIWEGTAQARVNGGSYSASPLTVTVSAGNQVIEFGTGTVSEAAFDRFGARFVKRNPAIELLLCQRYYFQTPSHLDVQAAGFNTSTTVGNYVFDLPAPMRVAPTSAGSTDPTHFVIDSAAGVIQCTNFTMLDLSPTKCRFSATVAAGLTAGQGSIFRAGNAAARLYFEAEL